MPRFRPLLAAAALACAAGCATAPRPAAEPALAAADRTLAQALAHFAQGLLYEHEYGRECDRALAEYEQAAALDPDRQRLSAKVALGHLLRQQPDAAVAALRASARRHPDRVQAWIDLAVTCQLTGRLEDAIAAYERAVALTPDDPFLYVSLARIHLYRRNDKEALAVLRRAFRHTEAAQLVLLASTRARQLVEDGQLETALTYFDLVAPFAASPSGEMDMLTGQLALQLERPEDAARRFLAATCAATPTPDAFIKLGVTLLRLDRRAEAVGALEQGATRFPASAPLLYTLALAHLQDGMPAAAIARLEQLRDAHEAEADGALMADFYVTLGSAYDRAGRFDRAEAVFLECVERYPDAHEALNYLAYLWAERDIELERAEAFIERALDLQPDNAAYLDTKGWILYRRGRYEDALALVLAADQRLPGDPVILDHLGDLYDALDRRADAMACWRRSLEADPANTLVALKLEAYGDNPDRLIRRARRRLRREEQAP